VIFNHEYMSSRRAVICRIGHYDKNYYLSRHLAIVFPPSTRNINNVKRPYGKIWHSFKVRPLFNVTCDRKEVNLSRNFDTFEEEMEGETSLTIKPKPRMSDYIKKRGWHMIPEESLGMKRRKVKEYIDPSLLPLLPEQLDWIKRRKKYPKPLS
jgi:hypothetical protein